MFTPHDAGPIFPSVTAAAPLTHPAIGCVKGPIVEPAGSRSGGVGGDGETTCAGPVLAGHVGNRSVVGRSNNYRSIEKNAGVRVCVLFA